MKSVGNKSSVGAMQVFALGVLFTSAVCVMGQPSPNRARSFGPDECGPADPAYIHTANETGGIPLFLQRSEAGKAFHLMRETTRDNIQTVFWSTDTFDDKPQTIDIPVDSVTKRITFTFSTNTKGNRLTLTQPSGDSLEQGSRNTEITELNCGRIVTVVSPAAGIWRAQLAGKGTFWMEAQAQSDLYFINGEFVEKRGRLGHEGLFRIPGQPVVGSPATLQVSLSAAAAKTTEFYLVDQRGHPIQRASMRPENSDREFLEFTGTLDLPNVPFRVAVIGRDLNGNRYQRYIARLFHAEEVEVTAKRQSDELSAGDSRQVLFRVRNIGLPRTFKITVTDARKFVTGVDPEELALAAGESGTVRVSVTVPPGTAPGVEDDVVFVATSTAGPATSNYDVVRFAVSPSTSLQNPR